MKKKYILPRLFYIFILAGTTGAGYFQTPSKFEKSFRLNFPGKTLTLWTKQGNFTVARFIENGEKHDAYFTNNASFEAVVRFTTLNKLPGSVIAAFKKQNKEIGDVSVLEIIRPDRSFIYLTQYLVGNKVLTVRVIPGDENMLVEIINTKTI